MSTNKSESSSEKRDVCPKNKCKCEPKCIQNCDIVPCVCYSPEEIVCRYGDAVVSIRSEFILIGASGPVAGPTGGTSLGDNSRADIFMDSNGFFIKGHYIVAPAHQVLMPASLTTVANRYPYFNPSNLSDPNRSIQNTMLRASRILVTVYNVNGKGHSFVYEADLVGVDGAGDIAVLRINFKKQWNFCNPCIEKCHPFLKFGSSRASLDGEKVYLFGDYSAVDVDFKINTSSASVIDGLLADHRYIDHNGKNLAELVLVSAPLTNSTGAPILNCQGLVIGMQTVGLVGSPDVQGFGYVAGPSEFFMRRVIKTLIKGDCARNPNCHLECIDDPVGSYYRYKKGYLGFSYELLDGGKYDTTQDFTSGGDRRDRVRLDVKGEFLNSPSCKEVVGVLVSGVAGLNVDDQQSVVNGLVFIPGGLSGGTGPLPPLASGLPSSNLLNRILPGDIITHLNGLPLGNLTRQIAPSLVTWRLCAGDQVELCYRRGGNVDNSQPNDYGGNYDNFFTINVCVLDYPQLLDYPWYALSLFPNLVDYGFVFPPTQSSSEQVPKLDFLVDGTLFKTPI